MGDNSNSSHCLSHTSFSLPYNHNDTEFHDSVGDSNHQYSFANCEIIDLSGNDSLKTLLLNNDCSSATTSNEDVNTRQSNYVYQVLMKSAEGKLLLHLYNFEEDASQLTNLLATKKRTFFSIQAVCKIIIFNEIERTNDYCITSSRLEELAESAVVTFPKYLKGCFYSRANEKSSAHGALQATYEGIREKAIATNYIKSKSLKRKKSTAEITYSKEFQDLKISVEVLSFDYIDKWKSTSVDEKKEFYKTHDLRTIISTLPNLGKPDGYTLIQADFGVFFNKDIDLFNKKWPVIAGKIVKLAKTKQDKEIKEILRSTSTFLSDNYQVVALILLPYLFRKICKQTQRKAGKNWYPEKKEILETFVLHIKETKNFDQFLQAAKLKIKEYYVDHKIPIQPFVIINGEALNYITSAYVIVNDVTYQVRSTLAAVDICFQVVKVFQKEFSQVCSHVWQFIESEVYELPVPNLYKTVADIISSYRRFE